MHIHVSACLGGRIEGGYKVRATVRIYGVVTTMICHHYISKTSALRHADSNGKHDTVTERYHSAFHVGIIVIALWYSIGTLQQTALEVLMHKIQGNGDVRYAQSFTVQFSKRYFAGIVIAAIVKADGKRYRVLVIVKHGDGVHSSAYDNY